MTDVVAAQVGNPANPQAAQPGSPKGAIPDPKGIPKGAAPAALEGPGDIDFEREVEASVNGQKEKVKLRKLLSDYQKHQAAEKRLQQATLKDQEAQGEKEKLRQFLLSGQKNPRYLLEKLLGSPEAVKKFSEDYIWEQIQNEKKTPQQLKLEQYEREAEERKQIEEAQKVQNTQTESQQRVTQLREHYDKIFHDALVKTSLPKTAETVERMSKVYMSYLKNGYEPSMDEVMDDVQSSYLNDIKGLLGGLDGDKLYHMLGEDLWQKAREYDVSRLAGGNKQPQKQQTVSTVNTTPKEEKMDIHTAKALWRKNAGM